MRTLQRDLLQGITALQGCLASGATHKLLSLIRRHRNTALVVTAITRRASIALSRADFAAVSAGMRFAVCAAFTMNPFAKAST